MAFTKLKLTTFGQTIESKRHQGKGIHTSFKLIEIFSKSD